MFQRPKHPAGYGLVSCLYLMMSVMMMSARKNHSTRCRQQDELARPDYSAYFDPRVTRPLSKSRPITPRRSYVTWRNEFSVSPRPSGYYGRLDELTLTKATPDENVLFASAHDCNCDVRWQ